MAGRRVRTLLVAGLLAAGACSPKQYVIDQASDALADSSGTSTVWTGEEDPELVRDSLPFVLKTLETLRDSNPKHAGLHKELSARFTIYAYAFVQEEADRLQDRSYSAAQVGWNRARRLYRRAHRYGLAGLEIGHPGFSAALRKDPEAAVKVLGRADVEAAYWTAVSLAAEISLSKDKPDVVAELPAVTALARRLLALDADWNQGALHGFMVTFESRGESLGGSAQRAQEHLERVVKLTGGGKAGPYVSWAEGQCVPRQDMKCFTDMLDKALAVDPDKVPAWRLENILSQRRAAWLKSRAAELIDVETPPEENG